MRCIISIAAMLMPPRTPSLAGGSKATPGHRRGGLRTPKKLLRGKIKTWILIWLFLRNELRKQKETLEELSGREKLRSKLSGHFH